MGLKERRGGRTGTGQAIRFGRRAIRISARSASLTDSESGKNSATSEDRTTTFVPAAYRAAYRPRSPPLKSYSGSMSGSRVRRDAFFIDFPLATGRLAGADDPDSIRPVDVHHDQ